MTFIVKIGLMSLFFLLFFQGIDADILSSAADKYVITDVETPQNMQSADGAFSEIWLISSQPIEQNRISPRSVLDDIRIRRAEECQRNFLKNLISYFSLREEILAMDHARIFPSISIHYLSPACHYFVFMLRHILI